PAPKIRICDAASAPGTAATPLRAARLPSRNRVALPAAVARGGLRGVAEMKQPRLRAGIRLDLQRLLVLPGDVHAAGDAHDIADAVRSTRVAVGGVLRGIPGVGRAPRGGVERHA